MTHALKLRRTLLPALVILLASLASHPALANNCTWNGGANADWGTPANWNTCGGTTPGSGDTVSIANVGTPPNVFTGTTPTIGALTLQSAAVLTVNGGSLTLNAGMTGPGSLGVQNGGTLGWTGGTIDGTGPLTFQPGTFFTLSGGAKTLGKSLTLPGTTVLAGAGSLTLSPGVVLQNLGTFDIQGDGGILGAGTLIVNSGTLLRTTSGTNPGIQADVNNNGAIQVTTGGLTFTGNTTNAGTVDASAASLYYDAGTHTFDNQVLAGHIIISAGTLSFNGPTTVYVSFVQDGAGTVVHTHTTFTSANVTELDGGHFFVDPSSAVTVLGNLVVASGATLTMSANVPVAATSLNQLGTIEGNQDLNVSGNTLWIGGIQLGPGYTRLMGTTTIGGTAVDVGRGLDLYGTTTWTGGGIGMTSPASLIRVIGSLSIDTSFTGLTGGGGKLMILASGSLSTPGGSSPLTIDVPVLNAGAVTLQDRPITLASYSQSSGSTSLQRLTYPLVVTQPVQITDGTLSGYGTVTGDLTISGTGSVSPGNIPGNPGTITVTGNYTQSAPVALLTDSIAPIGIFTDLVAVGGAATLGGPLNLSINFAPANGNVLPLMTYSKRVGSFGPLTLPALPAGLGWAPRYAANGFSLIVQSLLPAALLRVDQQPASSGVHNVNGVLDPGERVLVAPTWSNAATTPTAFTGTLSNITGPSGATYTIAKSNADYGSLLPAHSVDCFIASGNCYEISVDNPPARPAAHWDATVDETTSNGSLASWTIHIGGSFNDVSPTVPQYRFVETLFHNQITGGCGGGGFCPNSTVTRAQMAVFLLKAKFGPSYIPPPVAGGVFFDLPPNGFAPFIETLGTLGIAGGCGNNNFCPNDPATRAQMAVFLLKTEGGPSYVPPDCVTPTFNDVPCANGFSKWIEELARRGITAGCGNNNYCPNVAVTRGQMAVFLTVTFGLTLNGV